MSFAATSSKFLRGLFLAVLGILLVGAVGCTKAPETLEEYYEIHPDQLQKEIDDFESGLSGGDFAGSSVEVKGNEVVMTAALNMDFNDLDAETMDFLIATVEESIASSGTYDDMSTAVKNTEEATGIEGIKITIAYTDKNGTPLASASFDANGAV